MSYISDVITAQTHHLLHQDIEPIAWIRDHSKCTVQNSEQHYLELIFAVETYLS